MRALAGRDDILVLGTSGGRDVSGIDLPANARLERCLPFDRIMASADVFVTDGGFGSALLALADGVPMAIAGGSEEKPEIAARLAWSGAAINLETDRPTKASIAQAVDELPASDSRHRARARDLGKAISAIDSTATILAAVKRLTAKAPSAALGSQGVAWANRTSMGGPELMLPGLQHRTQHLKRSGSSVLGGAATDDQMRSSRW